jgi:hypothetical protein
MNIKHDRRYCEKGRCGGFWNESDNVFTDGYYNRGTHLADIWSFKNCLPRCHAAKTWARIAGLRSPLSRNRDRNNIQTSKDEALQCWLALPRPSIDVKLQLGFSHCQARLTTCMVYNGHGAA